MSLQSINFFRTSCFCSHKHGVRLACFIGWQSTSKNLANRRKLTKRKSV